ncbi:MAG: peptide deformylase [Chitinophagales bacterium]|nr:MAG: peptide deformylase [Chitinophagales bacterium]
MTLPIVAYGDPVLRKKTEEIQPGHAGLAELIENMFETMYNAPGVGLAAPQIGQSLRLFVVDSEQWLRENEKTQSEPAENHLTGEPIKQVFINPRMIKEYGQKWTYQEGCLSIPGIREDVQRLDKIVIRYFDENFHEYEKEFTGITARIIQHEYDHIEGILFTDRISPLRRQILKNRLQAISKGDVQVDYKMLFPARKKSR